MSASTGSNPCKCRECKPVLDGIRPDTDYRGSVRSEDLASALSNRRAPAPVDTETILEEAQRLVHGNRGDDYGHPIVDYERTGRMWGAILGIPDIDPRICCLMMVAVKLSREVNKHKRDNLCDAAGYSECAQMVADKQGLT
jgi:hypothetical protein